jgi:DNA-binding NarL/FixJ family response regulator
MKNQVLFVDDDPLIVESLSIALDDEFTVHAAENRGQAKKLLNRIQQKLSIALVDLGLPPHPHHPDEGFRLIEELVTYNPNMKILVLSGQNVELPASGQGLFVPGSQIIFE